MISAASRAMTREQRQKRKCSANEGNDVTSSMAWRQVIPILGVTGKADSGKREQTSVQSELGAFTAGEKAARFQERRHSRECSKAREKG